MLHTTGYVLKQSSSQKILLPQLDAANLRENSMRFLDQRFISSRSSDLLLWTSIPSRGVYGIFTERILLKLRRVQVATGSLLQTKLNKKMAAEPVATWTVEQLNA